MRVFWYVVDTMLGLAFACVWLPINLVMWGIPAGVRELHHLGAVFRGD